MKEIEIKAKLNNKEEIVGKLKNLGCSFEEQITQNDVVYVKNLGSAEEYNKNDVFLRIRIKNNLKSFFTLKKRIKNDLDALEYETEITSPGEMENALLLMGYQKAVYVNKTRIITHHDEYEICIDEVENLGSYIEMEKLVTDGDSEKIQDEMFTFFLSLGIKSEDRIMTGYDILMLQKEQYAKS
ncbi:MAG: class IV adenylate cyclase [Patescibacteria group bacterium]